MVELFTATSRVARLSRPAGALGNFSGTGQIVTAGAAQGRVPVLSVVFDAPMSFAPVGLAAGLPLPAIGFRVYPDLKQVLSVLDRYDVETVNEQLMEWIDQMIIHCPGAPRPTVGQVPSE